MPGYLFRVYWLKDGEGAKVVGDLELSGILSRIPDKGEQMVK